MLINARKIYKHCLIFVANKLVLSLMVLHTAFHQMWTGMR